MKKQSMIAATLALVAVLFVGAVLAYPPLPPPLPPNPQTTALYVVQNNGKDGVLWFVRFGQVNDLALMGRAASQSDAEHLIALVLETSHDSFIYGGHVIIGTGSDEPLPPGNPES